jgi:glycosyltransferase involved in cell wall biosynthesis
MRCLLVSEYFPPYIVGGAELSSLYLARSLANRGAQVTVVTVNFERFRIQRSHEDHLEVVYFPFLFHLLSRKWRNILFRSILFYVYFALVIGAFAARKRPHVLHVQNKHTLIPAFFAGRLLRIPVTMTVRDPMLICPSGMCLTEQTRVHKLTIRETLDCMAKLNWVYGKRPHLRLRNKLLAVRLMVDTRLKQWVFRRCDGAIFVSSGMKQIFLENGLQNKQMDVIYNIAPFRNEHGDGKSSLVREISSFKQNGGRIVLTVGKLSFGKGTQYLLDAVPLVLKERKNIQFVFAGPKEVKLNIPNAAEGSIRLVGRVPQETVFHLYDLADVVCQPSVWPEPFSRTLLEAMTYKKPIVATNVGGTAEAVLDGENGLLVPPKDSAALARALSRILDDRELAARMGQRGEQVLNERFDPDQLVGRHLEHYNAIANEDSRRHWK